MAERVYLHVGLPKTATTYLQTILWANREVLEEQGVRLPGDSRRAHLWASRVIREHPACDEAKRARVSTAPGTACAPTSPSGTARR